MPSSLPKKDKFENLVFFPPQGRRKKSIKIKLIFSEPDKERDEFLNKQILNMILRK